MNEFSRKRVESIKCGAGGRLIEISSKSGADSAPEPPYPCCGESLLVTKKNRYEEALNYRLIVGGFPRRGPPLAQRPYLRTTWGREGMLPR